LCSKVNWSLVVVNSLSTLVGARNLNFIAIDLSVKTLVSEEVVVNTVKLLGIFTRDCFISPCTSQSVLTEDCVFWADETELVGNRDCEVVWVQLLQRKAHMEDLALVVLISIVAIFPPAIGEFRSFTSEVINNILPDESGVVWQTAHDGEELGLHIDELSTAGNTFCQEIVDYWG